MADGSDMLDSFYSRLLLRDLVGKVVPGSLVLMSAYVALVSETPSPQTTLVRLVSAPLGVWLVLIPLGWLVSFALQAAGELLGLVRSHPKSLGSHAELYKHLVEFADLATASERQAHERFVVIREASGTAYLALLVAVPLLLWRFHEPPYVVLAVFALIVALLLRWLHRRHVDRQKDWRDAVVKYRKSRAVPPGEGAS